MSDQYQTYEEMAPEPWVIPSFEDSNKEFELIDPGLYKLMLIDVGQPMPVSPQYDPTGKKRRAQFTFKVVDDPDWEGYEINKWMNISMNKKSALYPFVAAILGGELQPNQAIQPNMLVGKVFQATVVHGEPNGEGKIWPEIQSPIPVRERRGRSGSRQTTVEDVQQQFDAEESEDLNAVPF